MKKVIRLITVVSILFYGLSSVASDKEQTKSTQNSYGAIVIGAGLSGLTSAAILSSMGTKVLLIEQNPYHVGGCTSSFQKTFSNGDSYTFEAALHQTGILPFIFKQLRIKYNVIGDPKARKVSNPDITFLKFGKNTIDELYETVVDQGNGEVFDYILPANIDDIENKLLANPEWKNEQKGIKKFCNYVRFKFFKRKNDLGNLINFIGGNSSLQEKADRVKDTFYGDDDSWTAFSSVDEFLDSINIKDKDLRVVLSQYWMYAGPPPSKLWAPFLFLMLNGYTTNCVQVEGTSQALSDVYANYIKKHGGEIHLGEKVLKINLKSSKNNKLSVTGVTTTKATYNSNYVISTADPFQTFYNPETGKDGMIGKSCTPMKTADILKNTQVSNSLFDIYLPLDKTYNELGIPEDKYEIFYQTSFNADESYGKSMNGDYKDSLAAIVLYSNLSKYENYKYAPSGKSELVITCYANPNDPVWWENDDSSAVIQARADDAVHMAAQCLSDVAQKEHLSFDKDKFFASIRPNPDGNGKYILGTPGDIHQFTMQYKGIPYGWDVTKDQFFSRLMLKNQINGLFLAGSWTLPSHGIEPAQLSGFVTAWWVLLNKFVHTL